MASSDPDIQESPKSIMPREDDQIGTQETLKIQRGKQMAVQYANWKTSLQTRARLAVDGESPVLVCLGRPRRSTLTRSFGL